MGVFRAPTDSIVRPTILLAQGLDPALPCVVLGGFVFFCSTPGLGLDGAAEVTLLS